MKCSSIPPGLRKGGVVSRSIAFILLLCCLGPWGCTKVQPIITPQEYQASCRQDSAVADAACVARVCDVYQAVVTDYYENKDGCYAACADRAQALSAGAPAQCGAKISAARAACREFCLRKFYRCNCDK